MQAGGSAEALRLSERMRQRGINVQPIVAPAVPDESARLFVNATHSAEQIDRAVEALRWSFAA